jgi:hypothetical protein
MKRILIPLCLLFCVHFVSAQQKGKRDSVKTKVGAGVGVELALNMCFGGTSNNSGNAEVSNFGYDSQINRGISEDTVAYSIGGGIALGFDINLLFGKRRNLGMSAGVLFISGFNSFNLENFQTEYKATDAEGRSFRRILSAPEWKEKVTYLSLSIPILFKYRYNWKKKVGFYADLGPLVTVLSTAKSKINAKLDYEAVYAMDGGPHYSEQSESSDWVITRAMAQQHISADGPYASANDYFAQLYTQGYYVGLDKAQSAAAPAVQYKLGFGALLRAGLIYNVNPLFSISFGAQCALMSGGRKTSSPDKPVVASDNFETNTRLNSILNSTGSLLKAQYGVNIGLHVRVVK